MCYGTAYGTGFADQMGKKDKLLAKALESPKNLRFAELCRLVEQHGFEHIGGKGSHRIYSHPQWDKILNLQPGKNSRAKVKAYQVDQVIEALEDLGLIDEE